MNYQDELQHLWDQISHTTDDKQKISLLEQVIQLIDFHHDIKEGIWARMKLIDTEQRVKSVVALTWIWTQLDQNPHLYEELGSYKINHLYHLYRRTIEAIGNHPTSNKQTILELIDDFCQRLKQAGYQSEIIRQKLNISIARDFQDQEWAKQSFTSLLQSANTSSENTLINDGPRWDLYMQARYYYEIMGDIDRALQEGKPILDGDITDNYIEYAFPSIMIIPLWKEGKIKQADVFQHRTEHMVIQKKWYEDMAWHLCFMTVTNQMSRATRFFEQHVSKGFHQWFDHHYNPVTELDFLLHIRVFFQRLQYQGHKTIALDISRPLPFGCIQASTYDIDEIIDWMTQKTTPLAIQFDQRNGNHHYLEKMDMMAKW